MEQMLGKLSSWIKNPQLISKLAGIVALVTVLWFVLAKLGVSSITAKLSCLVLIVLIFIATLFIKRWWSARKGEALSQKVTNEANILAGRQLEVELLKERMNEAINSLKTSELGVQYKGKAALYALPWYMIIGPSSCGKSTLLRNSGLKFPYSIHDDPSIKGLGGTKNCDWWLSDQAILLDTAGRYTTSQDDHEEWISFLALLKKYRPKLPVDGIIVALSVNDLVNGDRQELETHRLLIRERINELYSYLGYRFPIYLVLTKCDLIDGFEQFFHSFDAEQRNQVFGIHSDSLTAKVLQDKLSMMQESICTSMLKQIHLERDKDKKAIMMAFPLKFQTCLTKISQFFDELLATNPYQETPVFNGLFFTSGTQPVTVLDKNSSVSGGKNSKEFNRVSYFVKKLLLKVIIQPKSNIEKISQKRQKRKYLKVGALIGGVAMIALTLLLYCSSFTANTLLLQKGSELAKKVMQSHSKQLTRPQLNHLLNASDYYYQLVSYQHNTPFYLRLGLYRGNSQLELFRQLIANPQQQLFFKPIVNNLERELAHYHLLWKNASKTERGKLRGNYYTKLKIYLMMMYPEHLDLNFAVDTISFDWHQQLGEKLGIDSAQWKNLNGLVRFYLELSKQSHGHKHYKTLMKRRLVLAARHDLYARTNSYNLYSQIKHRGYNELEKFGIADLLKTSNADLFYSSYQLPGIYTHQGYEHFIQPQIKLLAISAATGDWVMDTPIARLSFAQISQKHNADKITSYVNEMTNYYLTEYSKNWLEFLSKTRLHRFGSLEDATQQLQILMHDKGPFKEFMKVVANNASFVAKLKQTVPLIKTDELILTDLTHLSDDDKDSVLSSYFNQLKVIQSEVEKLAISPDQGEDVVKYATEILSHERNKNLLYQSSMAIKKSLAPLKSMQTKRAVTVMMMSPLKQAWAAIMTQTSREIDVRWQQQVYSVYKDTIAMKFPFSQNGRDASLTDVTDFFKLKQGALWSFYHSVLSPFIHDDSQKFKRKIWLDIGLNVDRPFLEGLENSRRVSHSLFSNSTGNLNFKFSLYPHPIPKVKEILIETSGRSYPYRNGPQEWVGFSWPLVNEGEEETLLRITGERRGSYRQLEFENAWGIFHLLAKAKISHVTASRFDARWKLDLAGKAVTVFLTVRSASRYNLFKAIFIDKYSLPRQLNSHGVDDYV